VSISETEERSKVVSRRSAMDWSKTLGRAILKTVVEVSDVFPPLKSVAAGMKVIVDRIEVRRNHRI
jgi:hypothetical protein